MKASKKASDYEWNKKTIFGQRLITQEILDSLPESYATAEQSIEELKVYAHFFIGGWDWYLIEISDLENGIFFGYVNDRNDDTRSEFGSQSIEELASLQIGVPIHGANGEVMGKAPLAVERDIFWETCYFKDIEDLPERLKERFTSKK